MSWGINDITLGQSPVSCRKHYKKQSSNKKDV